MHGCLVWSLDHSFKNGVRTAVTVNTLGTGYLNCLYAYKRKSASPILNVLNCIAILSWLKHFSYQEYRISEDMKVCFQQGSTIAHAENYCGCTSQIVSSVADLLLWWCDTAWTFTQFNCSRPFISSVPCHPFFSLLGMASRLRWM
jgi:hypothetical protein